METTQATDLTGLTLEDLFDFPDDGLRRELIDGRLYVSPHPRLPHQRIVLRLSRIFADYADEHGGEVFPGCNVDPSRGNHFEPDVVVLAPGFDGRLTDLSVASAPSLIVEVSSPSTKLYDLNVKRDAYERQGVPEYWCVDVDLEEVRVFRLADGRYGEPAVVGRGEHLEPLLLPGLVVPVDGIFR